MNTQKTGRTKQARARKVGESVSYRVYIIGIAWEGFTGTYSYSFDHEPTEQEIKAKAGDFQSITDYETTRTTTIAYTDGERRIVKIVRPWSLPDSVDTYSDSVGC